MAEKTRFIDDVQTLIFGGARAKEATAEYNKAIADAINKKVNEDSKPKDYTIVYVIIILSVLMFLAALIIMNKKKS